MQDYSNAKRAVIAVALLVSACQSDKIDSGLIVDPDKNVSFSQHVLPILTTSCAGSGCHIGVTTNGVNLTNYAEILASIGVQYNAGVVIPEDAGGSPLIDKIEGQPRFGERMPLGRAPLTTREISLIIGWIDEGALDN